MLGFVTANIVDLDEAEKQRYRALYCGLCHELGKRHGQRARFCLSYDLTFLIMLLGSLYESTERTDVARCPAPPFKKMQMTTIEHTAYAADMAVALAYFKCLDDYRDEGKRLSKQASALLEKPLTDVRRRWPQQLSGIETYMARVTAAENDPDGNPDEPARLFGGVLGNVFLWNADDVWAESLWRLGAKLGRFIYFMDAAVDLEDDIAHDRYNPFKQLDASPDALKMALSELAGDAAAEFERLPLERDLHIMRSVLYAGVWQQFCARYEDGAQAKVPPTHSDEKASSKA